MIWSNAPSHVALARAVDGHLETSLKVTTEINHKSFVQTLSMRASWLLSSYLHQSDPGERLNFGRWGRALEGGNIPRPNISMPPWGGAEMLNYCIFWKRFGMAIAKVILTSRVRSHGERKSLFLAATNWTKDPVIVLVFMSLFSSVLSWRRTRRK